MIDIWRLLAAICVVFLHSNYPVSFESEVLENYQLIRSLYLSWAMPFFYATIEYFSLKSLIKSYSLYKVKARFGVFISYLGMFIIGIEELRFIKELTTNLVTYKFFGLESYALTELTAALPTVVRTANISVGYFFFDGLIILCAAVVVTTLFKATRNNYPHLALVIVLLSALAISFNLEISTKLRDLFHFRKSYVITSVLFSFGLALLLRDKKALPKP